MLLHREIKVAFSGVDIDPITDLRIVFDANKADGEQLNKATITIYNLNASSRNKLSKPRPLKAGFTENIITVLLYAGYKDNIKELIAGDIYMAHSSRVGADWITKIDLYSGIVSASLGKTSVSFNATTPAKQIADALIEPLGLSVSYTPDALSALTGVTYPDFSDSGIALRSINVFLKRFGLAFTIEDNEKGLVYKENAPRNRNAVRSDSNAFKRHNGLIGTPNITKTGIEFVSLLRPEIQILGTVFLESKTVTEALQRGELFSHKYFVKGIRHFGDNRGDEWFTAIEGFYPDILDEAIINV